MLNFDKDIEMTDEEIENFLKTDEANLQKIENLAKEYEQYDALIESQHIEYKEIDLETPSLFRFFIKQLPEINKAIKLIEKGDYARIEDVRCVLADLNTHVKMIASCMKKINSDFEMLKNNVIRNMNKTQDECLREVLKMSDKSDDIVEMIDIEM